MSKRALTLVNAFTLARFVLAAAIVVAAAANEWGWVFVYAVVAFATDWFDGAAARYLRVVSSFGKFVDPLADKAVCLAVLWPLALHYRTWPYWACAILITSYDAYTMGMRLFVRRATGTVVAASKIAKLKTATLMFGLLLATLGLIAEPASGTWQTALRFAGLLLLLGASVLAGRSWLNYSKLSLLPLLRFSNGRPRRVTMQNSIAHIDFATWHKHGITCLLMDIEGTIAPWKAENVPAEIISALLRARAAGIRDITVISNITPKDEQRVQNICRQIDVQSYWIPRELSERKPATVMLHRAMQHFDVKPAQVAYVGDKFVDVIAGKRAGVAAIVWVRRLGRADHPLDYWLYRPIEPIIRQFVNWLQV